MATSLRRVFNVIQRTAVDPRQQCAVVVGKWEFLNGLFCEWQLECSVSFKRVVP